MQDKEWEKKLLNAYFKLEQFIRHTQNNLYKADITTPILQSKETDVERHAK